MKNENKVFTETTDALNSIYPDIVEVKVRSWRNSDKYPCPKCSGGLGMPDYTCKKCNIKLRIIYIS